MFFPTLIPALHAVMSLPNIILKIKEHQNSFKIFEKLLIKLPDQNCYANTATLFSTVSGSLSKVCRKVSFIKVFLFFVFN